MVIQFGVKEHIKMAETYQWAEEELVKYLKIQNELIDDSKRYWNGETADAFRRDYEYMLQEGEYAAFMKYVRGMKEVMEESIPRFRLLQQMVVELPTAYGLPCDEEAPEILRLDEEAVAKYHELSDEIIAKNRYFCDEMTRIMDGCEGLVDFSEEKRELEELREEMHQMEVFKSKLDEYADEMRRLDNWMVERLSEFVIKSDGKPDEDLQGKDKKYEAGNSHILHGGMGQTEGVMGWDTGFVLAGAALVLEAEVDESITANVNEIKEREEILLRYLIEQGITISEQQRGVLRLIRTERPDILGTLYIMESKGAEGIDDVLEVAMEHCYGTAEEVFIKYMSQNDITDAAAHMIVLDRIRNTNPQLLLNLIAEKCDTDREAEGLLEYYDSLQEGMSLSLERYNELRELELADYHLKGTSDDPGVGFYNEEELIGIMPYYVMVNADRVGFEDDGGITFGIGHHISETEWLEESDREHELLSRYLPEDVEITGMEVDSLPGCGLMIVPNSTAVPIEEVNRIFIEDIQEFSNTVADQLNERGIEVTQAEFDALVIYAYNRGRLSWKALDYLEAGNRVPEDWQHVWSGGDNRIEYCQNLFFPDLN